MNSYYDDSDDDYDESEEHSIEDVRAHVIRFGRYKNQTLGQICRDTRGRSWLRWAMSKCDILSRKDVHLIGIILKDYKEHKLARRKQRLKSSTS